AHLEAAYQRLAGGVAPGALLAAAEACLVGLDTLGPERLADLALLDSGSPVALSVIEDDASGAGLAHGFGSTRLIVCLGLGSIRPFVCLRRCFGLPEPIF